MFPKSQDLKPGNRHSFSSFKQLHTFLYGDYHGDSIGITVGYVMVDKDHHPVMNHSFSIGLDMVNICQHGSSIMNPMANNI